jgi:hypothetical protein
MNRLLIVLGTSLAVWVVLGAAANRGVGADAAAPAAPASAPAATQPAGGALPEGFVRLFDGKTLDGWKGRDTHWKVEDGAIVGYTTAKDPLKHNEFLYTEKEYGDFEIRAKFLLKNHNSGIQVRSQVHPDFVVTGYQPDIAESTYTGTLYEEGGRGTIGKVDPKVIEEHFKKGQWNDYRIICKGDKIEIYLNGFQTVDYTEKKADAPKKGIIAFQLHAGPPMVVMFKDVILKELK